MVRWWRTVRLIVPCSVIRLGIAGSHAQFERQRGFTGGVYEQSAGTVIGTEGNGTTESVDYTDYELTPPSGTK